MSKKALVCYHGNCPDGFTSAWAAWRHFKDDAEYVPMFHDQTNRIDYDDRHVFFLDYCPKSEDALREMAKAAKSVTVLDHHATARDIAAHLIDEGIIKGTFDMSRSGAMLSWQHFHPEEEVPWLVRYVQDQDLWTWELNHAKEVNINILSYDYDFGTWESLHKGPLAVYNDRKFKDFVHQGSAILRKLHKDCDEIMNQEMMLNIAGEWVPAFNANYFYGSHLCNRYLQRRKVGAVAYFWINKKGEYVFGLRSLPDGPNVAKMAEHYGGGGHVNASGFHVSSLTHL